MSEQKEEYAVERDFTYVDVLQNGDILVRTEYGSLLTESMLKETIVPIFERVCRQIGRGQHLHIRIEVKE